MNNKTNTIILILILAVSAIGLVINLQPKPTPVTTVQNLGYSGYNELGDGVMATSVSIGILATGTTEALASNYGVAYRRLQNIGNTFVFCYLDDATTTLSVSGGGIRLATTGPESIYEIGPDNLYKGQIRCIAQTSTGTLNVMEK